MEVKNLKVGSRKTVGLRISEEDYKKINHLFDVRGIPTSKKLDYHFDVYKWTLYRSKPIIESGGKHLGYNIYGVCGDSTFGNIPWYYNITNCGNIRAGRHIYKKFLEQYYE